MSNVIELSEPSVDTLITTWTGLRLQRGPSATNLVAFANVGDIPYVPSQTAYTYVDVSGTLSDWYRVARYGPSILGAYSPAWPVTPQAITAGDGARRSLKNCRRVTARKMSSLQVVTCTADGSDDGTTFQSDQLATRLDKNRYRNWSAMPVDGVSAGQIRIIGEAAVNPETGLTTVAPPFLSKVYRGTQIEMHKFLPPDEFGALMGIRQCLNLALAECWTLDRLSFGGLSNTASYNMLFGDWLEPEAIAELYGPDIVGAPPVPFGPFGTRRDGQNVVTDIVGFGAGQTLNAEFTRQGDTYIKVGGVWTDNQLGFTNDDDECLFQPEFISEIALVYCYEAMVTSTTGPTQKMWASKAEDQRRKANILKLRLPRPPERDHRNAGAADWLSTIR